MLFGRGCTPVGAKGEIGEWGLMMEEEKPWKVPRREEQNVEEVLHAPHHPAHVALM